MYYEKIIWKINKIKLFIGINKNYLLLNDLEHNIFCAFININKSIYKGLKYCSHLIVYWLKLLINF